MQATGTLRSLVALEENTELPSSKDFSTTKGALCSGMVLRFRWSFLFKTLINVNIGMPRYVSPEI